MAGGVGEAGEDSEWVYGKEGGEMVGWRRREIYTMRKSEYKVWDTSLAFNQSPIA